MTRFSGWTPRLFLMLTLALAQNALAQDKPDRPAPPRAERDDPPPRPAADDAERRRPPRREVDPTYDPPLKFEAITYQIEIAADKVAAIDTQALASQGGSLVEFDKAIRALGAARVLYRADQTITIQGRNEIEIGGDVPIIIGTSVTPAGQPQNQLSRQRIGAKIDIGGRWMFADGAHRAQAGVVVELSDTTPGNVDVGGVKAPVFRSVRQNYGGELELGHPIVLLSVDGAGSLEAGKSVAYITRLMFRPVAGNSK
ncbi:hypothetical protein RAS1_17300 [Phycisphaerae bacterium RAS1]|nr:hypothetical protein RAS1_17300 [Phycisphaerae bacterium RAS1]